MLYERAKILQIHYFISVCSLNCLEGSLWSPGKEKCWIFPWIIKDTFKSKSLQHLQEYSRSLCLHLEPGHHWSAYFWQGSQSLPEFPVQQVRRGPIGLQKGKVATWHSSRSHLSTRAAATLGTAVSSGTSYFCMEDQ